MADKRLGQPGAIEQPKRYSGGPNKPVNLTRSFRGSKQAVLAVALQMRNAGYEWSFEEGPGPNATATCDVPQLDGQGEVPVDTWELMPGAVEKDLLEADKAAIEALSRDQKDKIRAAVEANSSGALGTDATSLLLYDLMQAGVKAFRQFAPVLRHTRTVSSSWAIQAANTYAGQILSNGTLISFEAPPAGFLINLSGAPFTNVSARATLKYGWFKYPPTLQATYGSRFQISQEWEFGLWSTFMYGALV